MSLTIIKTCAEMSAFSAAARRAGQSIGFVPTMGALHEGHYSLVRRARAENGAVVASIFVNPTQFGPKEDLSKYPRPFEQDVAGCEKAGVDAVFAPAPEEMYPAGFDTYLTQERLTGVMCGASRPNHFGGVLTVCCKLFNVVAPDVAYFGQKDYQQTRVIKRMVADLCMPLRIEVCETVREADGLAMSSRNRYLMPAERADAVCLYRALKQAESLAASGVVESSAIVREMKGIIGRAASATVDYVAVADPETLQPLDRIADRAVVALAVKIGSTRLIDNMVVTLGPNGSRR